MAKSRSCREFKETDDFEGRVNCAVCKRWLPIKHKCREMIWLKEWVDPRSEVEFDKYDREMRNNKGVYLG